MLTERRLVWLGLERGGGGFSGRGQRSAGGALWAMVGVWCIIPSVMGSQREVLSRGVT